MQFDYLDTVVPGGVDMAFLLDDVMLLYGCEAAARVRNVLHSFNDARLDARVRRLHEKNPNLSGECILESLGLNFVSCLKGCNLQLELEFDYWGDEWEEDSSFSTVCSAVNRFHGEEAERNFVLLVRLLSPHYPTFRDCVSAVLRWDHGVPNQWFHRVCTFVPPPISFEALQW